MLAMRLKFAQSSASRIVHGGRQHVGNYRRFGDNDTAKFIFVLFGFAAGFAVRPVGAIFFGRLGDLIGRKYTFLVTMTIMGLATFIVGLLPGYQSIGYAAPVAFIAC